MLIWIISGVVIGLLLLCLIFMIRHFHDSPSCSIMNDEKYRVIIGRSVHRDFEGVWEQLLEILDGIREQTRRSAPSAAQYDFQLVNTFFEAGKDVYNRCLNVQKTIRDIWVNKKYTKDFYFFVALHYASRSVGQILGAQYNHLKIFYDECSTLCSSAEQRLESLRKEHLEAEDMEKRRELNRDMDKMRKQVEEMSNLKTQFGEILHLYQIRIERQNYDTLQRSNFIGSSFKRQGPDWRESMTLHVKH